METEALYALRDPAGIPFYPVVFMGLGVLTFALHMFAVQLMLGASGLTVFGAFSTASHWRRLSQSMVNVAKVAVSVAIVIGVAPLLFVQVIYDPFWYTSNVLSARWVIAWVAILIAAYWLMYVYYFRNAHQGADHEPRSRWAMVGSVVLLLTVGFIMHLLTSQMMYPEQWLDWYAPNGQIDASGAGAHAFNLWRFAFFILGAVPVTGAWLVAYRRYFLARPDMDAGYLEWTGRLGANMLTGGGALMLVAGILWMATLPEKTAAFALSPWSIVGAVAVMLMLALGVRARSAMHRCGFIAPVVALVAGLLVAAAREGLRYATLYGVHGYDFMDYKMNMDWYSTILFFATFAIVGGSTLAYLISIAWQAGRTEGVYTPGPVVQGIGTFSLWAIVLWIAQYFIVGFYVWAQ